MAARVLTFPDPVDDISARLVAAGVIVLALSTIVLDQGWLTIALAYGFLARVLAGPRFSPLALLACADRESAATRDFSGAT